MNNIDNIVTILTISAMVLVHSPWKISIKSRKIAEL